jgi:hypothetical protein
MLFFTLMFCAMFVVLYFCFNPKSNTVPAVISNLEVDVSAVYDSGYASILTWKGGNAPFTITAHGGALQCSNQGLVQEPDTCWASFNAPTRSGNTWTATGKSYNRSGNDITYEVQGPINTESVTANVMCILGTCLLQTADGGKEARRVNVGDFLLQQNGVPKRVTSVKTSMNFRPMYKSSEAYVTEWHPVKYSDEPNYVVAKEHPLLTKVDLGPVAVYHFELENLTDDILFVNDSLIAESWNSLPHGVAVLR